MQWCCRHKKKSAKSYKFEICWWIFTHWWNWHIYTNILVQLSLFQLYFVGLFQLHHDFWWCTLKKGEVRRTHSPTLPIQLNVTFSFGWSKRKRKHVFSKMAVKLNLKKHRSPQCESITPGQPPSVATFHNPLHSHWSLPLKEDQYCQANDTNLFIGINFFLIDDAMNEKISSMHI